MKPLILGKREDNLRWDSCCLDVRGHKSREYKTSNQDQLLGNVRIENFALARLVTYDIIKILCLLNKIHVEYC